MLSSLPDGIVFLAVCQTDPNSIVDPCGQVNIDPYVISCYPVDTGYIHAEV